MKPKQRRLAAIMFTDIVGYSSMMQKDEEVANRLRVRHREVFQRLHERFGGEILQYYGDGTLSIFSSAVSAVECGVALQQALKKDPKVPIRIGIHTGDITFDEQEVYGDGVNVAARIESLCVPGGVFVSGKVYDDIKNHNRLRAKSLGGFQLKNIQQDVSVFAIINNGVSVPEYEWQASAVPETKQPPAKKKGRKSKWVAAILALCFGIFGAHRFYLGQRKIGIFFLAFFFLANFIIPGLERFLGIPAIIGFIDFIAFLAMPKATFDEKYNELAREEGATPASQEDKAPQPRQILKRQFEEYRDKGMEAYQNYDYDDATGYLIKAIEIKYDDPEAHFLLACCYSVNEETEKALSHLDVAVAFGLRDPGRINTHDDLSYLRIQPAFEQFKANGFRLAQELPPPSTEWMEAEEEESTDLLEQLQRLERERAAGRLSEEEYRQREKELRDEKD